MAHPACRLLPVAVLVLLACHGAADEPAAKPAAVPAEEIRKLIVQLGDVRFLARESASQRLTAIGRPALSALREASRSMDAEIASRAQRIVAEIQTSLPFLVDGLKDADSAARKEAAIGLERLGPKAKEVLPALIAALKDSDEGVRESVVSAVLAIDPFNASVAELVPPKAHVEGKYRRLQRRIKVPEDRQSYTEYRDYGYYQACDWAGHTNLPAGYWVYVYPHWYIWKETANDK